MPQADEIPPVKPAVSSRAPGSALLPSSLQQPLAYLKAVIMSPLSLLFSRLNKSNPSALPHRPSFLSSWLQSLPSPGLSPVGRTRRALGSLTSRGGGKENPDRSSGRRAPHFSACLASGGEKGSPTGAGRVSQPPAPEAVDAGGLRGAGKGGRSRQRAWLAAARRTCNEQTTRLPPYTAQI